MIEYVEFKPVKKQGSLIGFCSFKDGRDYSFFDLGVHKFLKAKGNLKIRLVYPDKQTPNREKQQEYDNDVNAYLLANYKEVIDAAYKDGK